MVLPGGLWRDGERRRGFAFRPLSGEVELAIAEAGAAENPPAAVTAVLAATLAEVGGEPVSVDLVRELAVGDRQFLVRQLAAWLGRDGVWLTTACGSCGAAFDFHVEQSALPVKEAGEGYPFVTAGTARGRHRLRLPNGADQEAIAGLPGGQAELELLRRCRLEAPPAAGEEEPGEEKLAALDAALEAVAPEVGLAVLAGCPECGHEQQVAVDPYLCLLPAGTDLYGEIHTLAAVYGWSETAILALPTARRRRYLTLIDHARGVAG